MYLIPIMAGIPLIGAILIFLNHNAKTRGYTIYATVAAMMISALAIVFGGITVCFVLAFRKKPNRTESLPDSKGNRDD